MPPVGEVVFMQPLLHRVEPIDPFAWSVGLEFRAGDERLPHSGQIPFWRAARVRLILSIGGGVRVDGVGSSSRGGQDRRVTTYL